MLQAFQGQHLEAAERLAKLILKSKPKDLVALQIHGLSLAMQGRISEAVAPFNRAVHQDPKNSELLSNLAKAQHGAELYVDAVATYKKLDRLIPNNPQILTDMATTLAKSKFYDEAAEFFNRAISIQPDYFLAWSNQGNLLAEMGFTRDAIASYEKAMNLNPEYAETWSNYGNAMFDLNCYQEGRLAHERALELRPDYAEAWSNYGNTLLELRDPGDYAAYQKAYSLNPSHPFLLGQLFSVATGRCDWKNSQTLGSKLIERAELNEKVARPFVFLHTSASLSLQKLAAEIYIRDRISIAKMIAQNPPSRIVGRKKIRIGYISSDFKEHPVGILMEHLLKMHNREQYEVYGFFLNASTNDPLEHRLVDIFDATFNLHGVVDSEAVSLVRACKLDIAIDLNGHTSGARTALFANKIAPIQINYLGYAGTSGADFYDAIIADRVVIPLEDQIHFSEKIEYLPNSFFPVDTSISIADLGDIPSRASQNLPESGFIFTCFNNSYKITPEIFDVWMNILKEIPESVLWLSNASPEAVLNLQNEAVSRGVDSTRLIFASRIPDRKEHLSRLRLADLFLDTPLYNAHATAADALWSGVPLLTIIGETFAGRVAASLLSALGLTELIVRSEREYFEKAVELARHPELLGSIRTKLEANRTSSTLFDTKQYVQDLESLYSGLLNKAN